MNFQDAQFKRALPSTSSQHVTYPDSLANLQSYCFCCSGAARTVGQPTGGNPILNAATIRSRACQPGPRHLSVKSDQQPIAL
jgi:thymidine kinase